MDEFLKHLYKEVPVSQVFSDNISYEGLFYTGRFDFVVYERTGKQEYPVLAIELDGKEHYSDEIVKERDRQKNQICRDHNFELIRLRADPSGKHLRQAVSLYQGYPDQLLCELIGCLISHRRLPCSKSRQLTGTVKVTAG